MSTHDEGPTSPSQPASEIRRSYPPPSVAPRIANAKRRGLGDMQSSTRLHHLDFLRAALMFLGVLVPASHADYDLSQFGWVRFFSGSFRMACFFLVSGYFAPQL